MGWLLGCFKCTGKPEGVKSKLSLQPKSSFSQRKKQHVGVNNLVSGRSNSAAVAHVTSPEDLHVVRKSLSNLAATNSQGHVEKEPLSSPLQDLAKTKKSAKSISKQDEDRVWSYEYDLDGELESFRERLLQDANATKQLSDEVKFLRGCHSLLESPSNAFKITFDKSDQDSVDQVDYAQHSWVLSSLVTRIQPGGLVIEACSRPSSPLLNLCEGGSVHSSRGIHASESNSCNSFGGNNALKCAELSLFRLESNVCDAFVDGILQTAQNKSLPPERYVPSTPWTNEKITLIDEPLDDLLLEHLDVSSLIEDSALITNWELSSGSSCPDTWGLDDQLSQVPSTKGKKLLIKSSSFEQENQKPSESRTDGGSLGPDSNCIPVVFEARTKNEPGLFVHPFGDETNAPHGSNEVIYAEEKSITKDADRLFQAESCMAAEEHDGDSTSQTCFSSQFRLSKRGWSSTRKNSSDRQPEMELVEESKSWEDEHHPLLGATSESSITSYDNGVSHGDYTDLHMNGNVSYFSIGSLEAKIPQGTAEDFLVKDDGSTSMGSLPLEEEEGEQRKKIKIGVGSLSGQMQEGMLAEEDEVPLLDAAAIEDGHESSLKARTESFSEYESTVSKCATNESSFEQSSSILPSSPHNGTPPSVTSYRSPASLADERPILGTVAAHWSPITTRKWWDGKGIPNSTNKYQEDQKVNWHALPFEVRLEQALAKQDTVLSK